MFYLTWIDVFRYLDIYLNINIWLFFVNVTVPKTKKKISDKLLRIIAVTHEELPVRFIEEAHSGEDSLQKGQMMEIKQSDEMEEGKDITTDVVIYPKRGG